MIPQNTNEIQAFITDILQNIPVVFSDNKLGLYFLIKDLSKDLESFINTGKTELTEFSLFSKEQECAMATHWESLELTVTYHSQRITYMYKEVTIKYLRVKDPKTKANISLIPWFMLHGKPYPVFTYVYANWYYRSTDNESLRLSAAAAGKLFGVPSLNKSTVCRNIRAMEHIFDINRLDKPLSVEDRETPTVDKVMELIPEILGGYTSSGLSEEMDGDKPNNKPESANQTETVPRALSAIPHEYSEVINKKEAARYGIRDTRKRPARKHKDRRRPEKRELSYTSSQQLEEIRKAFILSCRGMVMDAATTNHHLLL